MGLAGKNCLCTADRQTGSSVDRGWMTVVMVGGWGWVNRGQCIRGNKVTGRISPGSAHRIFPSCVNVNSHNHPPPATHPFSGETPLLIKTSRSLLRFKMQTMPLLLCCVISLAVVNVFFFFSFLPASARVQFKFFTQVRGREI